MRRLPHNVVRVVDICREMGLPEKQARNKLRRARFQWHQDREFWDVVKGSPEHHDVMRVLTAFAKSRTA